MSDIIIRRTGRIYSFSGVEFLAKFPDGSVTTIWSPPWGFETDSEGNEYDLPYDSPKQDEGALKYASELWNDRKYLKLEKDSKQIKELIRWLDHEVDNNLDKDGCNKVLETIDEFFG